MYDDPFGDTALFEGANGGRAGGRMKVRQEFQHVDNASINAGSIRASRLIQSGLFLGVSAGAWFGALDLLVNSPHLPTSFGGLAVLIYAFVGTLAGLGMAVGLWVVLNIARVRYSPVRAETALIVSLAFGILLLSLGRMTSLLVLPLLILVCAPVGSWWAAINAGRRASCSLGALAIGLAVALMSCLLGSAWGHSSARTAVVGLMVLAIVLAIWRLAKLRRMGVVLSALLVVVVGLPSIYRFFYPLASPSQPPSARGSGPPNVVIIVLDTFRRDFLGCYGSTGGLTPNLDALAAKSTLYEDVISASPWTMPSHASLFTGFYPKTHGCSSQQHRWLDDDAVTLAEMLSDEGYQTVSIVANVVVHDANLEQGFQDRVFLREPGRQGRLTITPALRELGAPARWMDKGATDAVVELDRWFQTKRDPDRPMFLFVNVMEPHQPYQPPIRQRLSQLNGAGDYLAAARLGANEFEGIAWHARGEKRPTKVELARALYSAEIAYQDQRAGEFMKRLASYVDLNETLVIITADHGENLGEAQRWGHLFAVDDYLLRVPLLIQYPRMFPAGKRVSGLCQLTDIVPTVFDVLGRPCPVTDLPGRSLVPATFQPMEATYAQWWPQQWALRIILGAIGKDAYLEPWTAEYRVIRTANLKYIWSSDGHHALYDVAADPDESQNLVAVQPQLAASLQERLNRWWERLPAYVPKSTTHAAPPDPETLESLKSLGYVGD